MRKRPKKGKKARNDTRRISENRGHPMSDNEPIYIRSEEYYVTDADRKIAIRIGLETGRPVIVNATPKPRWWQFWKRKK